jgi:prephenate dehydratase
VVLDQGIEDEHGNVTRFLWIAAAGAATPPAQGTAAKTSIVFHGAGDASPGWLVRCLSELAFRGLNMVRIESRPLKRQLGHYLFLVDFEGREDDGPAAEAIEALRRHCEEVRVLGSYAVA